MILPEKFLGYSGELNPGSLGWQSDVLSTIPNRQSFVIPWDQILYPCVIEVCLLGLEPLCDTLLSVILKKLTLTGQVSTVVS